MQTGRCRASLRKRPSSRSSRNNAAVPSKSTTSALTTASATSAGAAAPAADPASPAATEAARATAFCRDPAAEVLAPAPLEVEVKDAGRRPFPPWLRGQLWRVGPGCFPAPMRHLFDGFAMVAKLDIDGSRGRPRATHQQRFLETRAWTAFREKGRLGYSEFGTPQPVPEALFALAKAALGIGEGSWTDNASVTIRPVPPPEGKGGGKKERGGKGTTMLAATESVAGWVLLDAGDLSTLGNAELLSSDGVAGELTTAHAQLSRRRKLINLVSAIGGEAVLVAQDPSTLARAPLASLAPRGGQSPLLGRPWVHELPCAGRFAVVPEGSLPMDLVGALTGSAKHFMFSWLPELGTRYHVVDLEAEEVSSSSPSPSPSPSPSSSTKAPALPVAPYFDHPDPNFYFHVVNAFVDEDAREFVFDVPAHADAAMLDILSLENLRSNARTVSRSRLTRVRVPLPLGKEGEGEKKGEGEGEGKGPGPARSVRVERLFADADDAEEREPFFFEFPSPNPRFRGRKGYRFAWGLSAVMPTSAGNALAKVDVSGRERARTWHEPGCLPGEPLMVPRPRRPSNTDGGEEEDLAEQQQEGEEDDGVVLSLVVGADGGSFLLVLDAETMEEIARAELGAGLPYGFHCCWVDSGSEEEED